MAISGYRIPLNTSDDLRSDVIKQTEKVTTAYFSNGSANLLAANVVSSSLTDTNENYFFGISHSDTPSTVEFHVAFGSTTGYGATKDDTKSKSEAIYKQFANRLLAPTEITGGFFISSTGTSGVLHTAGTKDTDLFFLSAVRGNMKDRLNKGSWTIALSGSNTAGNYHPFIQLTDDSVNNNPTATPAGDRYNVVSGSAGTVTTAASVRNYGFFYPDQGLVVLSQQELSASIPGTGANKDDVVVFDQQTHHGFGIGTGTGGTNKKIALRFINCLKGVGTSKLTFRDEEDRVSAQYFCRVKNGEANFSTNPTFVSGSRNEFRQKTMRGNPNVYITGVQLYNEAGDLVAVGNLSTPLKKNFSSEATIKVKLTY